MAQQPERPAQPAAPARAGPPTNESEGARVNRALAEAAAEAEERQADETTPGGVFIVDGVKVDCNGKPLEDKKD